MKLKSDKCANVKRYFPFPSDTSTPNTVPKAQKPKKDKVRLSQSVITI